MLRGDRAHQPGHGGPIHLEEFRLDGRHGVDKLSHQLGSGGPLHPSAHPAVVDHQVDAVAGAAGQCGQEQSRLERRVDPRLPVDPRRGRAAAVDDDDDAAVAFGAPRPHDEVLSGAGRRRAPPRSGPPVDGSDIIAPYVFAQAVELGALAANHHARAPVKFTEPREAGRQVFP